MGRRIRQFRAVRFSRLAASGATLNGFNDFLELPSPNHRIDGGYLFQDLFAITLHQAPCDHQALRSAVHFMLGHLQNRIHRLLLRRGDKAACVNDQHVRFVGSRRHFVSVLRENAHHDLTVDEVFGASQA